MGGVFGGARNFLFGDKGPERAADAQVAASDRASQQMQPFRDAGLRAVSRLEGGGLMNDWQADPGYQFRMQEGMKALEASAAARGGLGSGATLKALTQYGQNLASQEYGNIYNRRFGEQNALGNWGIGAANQINQNILGVGNAQAAATMANSAQQNRAFEQALQSGITAYASGLFSDRNLKTDIEPVSKEDVKEFRAVIKPYIFKYKDELFGKGKWMGVMAQDLEKSRIGRMIVDVDHEGRKFIDMKKLMSAILATLSLEVA